MSEHPFPSQPRVLLKPEVRCLFCSKTSCCCTRNTILQIIAIAAVVIGVCIAIWELVMHVG